MGESCLLFFREAVVSRKRLSCNGLGSSDLPGKPLARLAAPLAPETQGKGLGAGQQQGRGMVSTPHVMPVSCLSLSLSPCPASPAMPPSHALSTVPLAALCISALALTVPQGTIVAAKKGVLQGAHEMMGIKGLASAPARAQRQKVRLLDGAVAVMLPLSLSAPFLSTPAARHVSLCLVSQSL